MSAPIGLTDALRWGSALVAAKVTLWKDGVQTAYDTLPVSSAKVVTDRYAAQRRTGNITVQLAATIPPSVFLPATPSSPSSPFGNEVSIEYGMVISGEVSDFIRLGLFAITEAEAAMTGVDLVTTLTLADRSWIIDRCQFIQPYNVPAASGNFVDEIQTLLNNVWANRANRTDPLVYNIVPTTAVVPSSSANQGTSPWSLALDMAAAVGYELYFDNNGQVVGRPIPDPSTQPVVWGFQPNAISAYGSSGHPVGGNPYLTPAAITSKLTATNVANDFYVAATGSQNAPGSASGSTKPIVGHASDTNPSSVMYVSGPFGDVPNFTSTNIATTQAQADAIAANNLAAAESAAWQITVLSPPMPILDVDDVVTVTNPWFGYDSQKMVVDHIEFDVAYDAQTQVSGRVVT